MKNILNEEIVWGIIVCILIIFVAIEFTKNLVINFKYSSLTWKIVGILFVCFLWMTLILCTREIVQLIRERYKKLEKKKLKNF